MDATEKAIVHLIHALQTDGAHHKQWDIEQALKLLMDAERYTEAKAYCDWEPGIPS